MRTYASKESVIMERIQIGTGDMAILVDNYGI
jgi:hypothetical protein